MGVKRICSEMQGMPLNDPILSEPNGASVQIVLENSIASRVLRHVNALGSVLNKNYSRLQAEDFGLGLDLVFLPE